MAQQLNLGLLPDERMLFHYINQPVSFVVFLASVLSSLSSGAAEYPKHDKELYHCDHPPPDSSGEAHHPLLRVPGRYPICATFQGWSIQVTRVCLSAGYFRIYGCSWLRRFDQLQFTYKPERGSSGAAPNFRFGVWNDSIAKWLSTMLRNIALAVI